LSGVCIAALNAQNAGEVQDLQYVQGTLNMLELPFPVRSCTFSKNGLVQADVVNGGKTLRINALTTGSTEMQLIGADMMKMYRITVISDLRSMYQSMLHDFEEFPEVEAEISGSRIIIRGDISNLEHWRLFRKYVSFYQGSILNLVKFHPKAEMMLLLNSALESEGYKVVESNGKVLKHGELAITQMGDVMEISGTVYSPADIERITQVINSQNWLSTGGGDDTKVHAVMNVIVVPELMEISAVFVGIDRSYLKDVGSTFFITGIPINGGFKWNGMSDLHKWTDGGTFRIGTNLETALNIFGANNHSVFRRAGYLTFKSNDDSARTLHDGG